MSVALKRGPMVVFVIRHDDGRYYQGAGWTAHLSRATTFGFVKEAMDALGRGRYAVARMPAALAAQCSIVRARLDDDGRTVAHDG